MTSTNKKGQEKNKKTEPHISQLVAQRIKRQRHKEEINQEELADLANVSRDTIINYEAGNGHILRFDYMLSIAEALDVPLAYFDPNSYTIEPDPWEKLRKAFREFEVEQEKKNR